MIDSIFYLSFNLIIIYISKQEVINFTFIFLI